MRESRFTEEQMVNLVREADRSSVPEVAKYNAISEQTLDAWGKKFGELEVSDAKRVRAIELENARLKTLLPSVTSRSRSPRLAH